MRQLNTDLQHMRTAYTNLNVTEPTNSIIIIIVIFLYISKSQVISHVVMIHAQSRNTKRQKVLKVTYNCRQNTSDQTSRVKRYDVMLVQVQKIGRKYSNL